MVGKIVGEGDKTRYYLDGKQVSKAEFDEAFPDRPIGDGSGLIGWEPLASDAMAVHPKQIEEAKRFDESLGVPTDYLPDGRPVFTSRKHRKAFMAAHGVFDKHAGYGDQADGGPRRAERDAANQDLHLHPEV